MATERKNFKNLIFQNHKAQSLNIWYIASSSGPLPKLLKLSPWGQKWPRPGGHLFYIDLYRENFKNLLLKNHKAQNLENWYVSSCSGPVQNLFKLFSWGQKWPRPRGHQFHYIVLYSKSLKIFSETVRPRAQIFGIQHHLVDLYQICSNYCHRVKIDPAQGVLVFTQCYMVNL